MGRFRAKSGNDDSDAEGASWSNALSQVLDRLGLSGQDDLGLSPLGPDLEVEVTDSLTGARIAISTLGIKEDPELDSPGADDDTTDIWEPPSPERAALFSHREDDGPDELEAIRSQCGDLATAVTLSSACELALDVLMAAIPAESASVLLLEGDSLRFVAARGPRASALVGTVMPASEGIAGVVVSRGKGLMIRQAGETDAVYRELDRKLDYNTRALLAVPMIREGRALGVVELLNPFGSVDFAQWHQRAAVYVSRHLARRAAAE